VNKLALHLPLNSTSLGQVSLSILRELFNRKKEILLFPIGNVDVSSQDQDPNFFNWIQNAILAAPREHSKDNPIFKLWHINGSLESFSNKQVLFTFYEVDYPTEIELNIIKNNTKVLLSSNYAVNIFKSSGANNVEFVPLAFDSVHFKNKNLNVKKDGIHFGLFGKLEPQRKRHLKVLQLWSQKYGNRQGYYLNCALFNPFIDANMQSQMINQVLGNQRYWNINFLPYLQSNTAYNDLLNNTDIVLAMSGGEGWGLPEFQTVALGKHCVGLNAHAYKDWMTEENTALVKPTGKIPVYDNIFFKKGAEFNQGSIFDWESQDFFDALDQVELKFKNNPVNKAGLELQEKFTYSKMVDSILDIMNNI
jgi:hypothetical protein